MRKIVKSGIMAVLLILSALLAYAIPVPHGVSGHIYELDGLTQVPFGTLFVVNDTTSGYFVSGKTGFGGEGGKYVVALNGNDGDSVTVRAWNSLHFSNTTISLTGVMANINLLLNTTIPTPPVISSSPVIAALEDEQYSYQIIASDRDNDSLSYLLVEFPRGMGISESGTISWLPLNGNVGQNGVKVRVDDGTFSTYQNFTVEVSNVNDIPAIISVPVTRIAQNSAYEYAVIAYDEDGDSLSYWLSAFPSGMSIYENIVSWLPNNSNVGNSTVVVNAGDGYSFTSQQFVIEVENVNDAPAIISSPLLNATEDEMYYYNISAFDPDGDVLSYSLIAKPSAMQINNTLVAWLPENHDAGFNNVTLEVSDGNSSAFQSFLIYVANANDAPNITSSPPEDAVLGSAYQYDVRATDSDNDTLSFSLSLFPDGMEINNLTGLIEWKPRGFQAGGNAVRVVVSDGRAQAAQAFTVTVKTPSREVSGSGSSGGGGGGVSGGALKESASETKDVSSSIMGADKIEGLVVRADGKKAENAVIIPLKERPHGTSPISRRVYKYFMIEVPDLDKAGDAEIIFSVEKEWLDRNKVAKENVVLSRFVHAWEELPSSVEEERSSEVVYSARTPGFSYFAVSVRNEAPVGEINSIQQPAIVDAPFSSFIVAGQVFETNRRQVPAGIKVNITNLDTGRLFSGNTGVGPYTGGFFIIVDGRAGDELLLKVEGSKGSKVIALAGDTKDIRITRRANVLEVDVPGITGFTIFGNSAEVVVRPFAAIMVLAFAAALFIFGRKRK